jgi:hypothetical protein
MSPRGEKTTKTEPEHVLRTAKDDKTLHRQLAADFTDDELQSISIIPEGQRLQQGEVYVDLNDETRREFTATGDMVAAAGRRITSKSEVPSDIWNRLIGVQKPKRTEGRRPATGATSRARSESASRRG